MYLNSVLLFLMDDEILYIAGIVSETKVKVKNAILCCF